MRKRRPKNEIDNIDNSSSTSRQKKGDKGPDIIKGQIKTLVESQLLKRLKFRQEMINDKLVADGKGGKNLENFCADYSQNYKFSARDKLMKPSKNQSKSNILLRQVSEMEEYR